jgi:predicted RNA binding protein YcfA (HicA-like mRNA interferase family)
MKARELRRVLDRQPLAYRVHHERHGSHVVLVSENGYPRLVWAFHDGQTLPPGLVRNILEKQVGLSDVEALALL